MKRGLIALLLLSSAALQAQNIAVNTSGTAAASTNLFEVTQSSATNNTVGIFATHTGAATNAYAIWAATTGATNKYAIVVPSGGGNVGIGTITPRAQLDVVGAAGTENIYFGAGTNTYPSTPYSGYATLAGKALTSDYRITLQDGNNRVNHYWNAYYDATAGSYKYIVASEPATRMRMGVSANEGFIDFFAAPGNAAGGTFTFTNTGYISNVAAWLSPRGTSSDFYIPATTGYVGIGTTNPLAKLHIYNGASGSTSSSTYTQLAIENNGDAGIMVSNPDANIGRLMFGSPSRQYGGLIRWDYTNSNMDFGTDLATGTLRFLTANFAERMRITSAGYVGIGSTAPNRKLEILSGNSDGITFGQESDNTQTIQTFIDGQWSNRATYAGGCCNYLAIQPDVGLVGIGTITPSQKLDLRGNFIQPNDGSIHYFPEVSANTSYHGLMDNNGLMSDGLPYYGGVGREPGAWAYPYPDFVISNHTGLRMAAHGNYGGISFYEQLNAAGTAWTSTGREIARFRDNAYAGSYFLSKLGIGNTTPSANLDVAGTFKLADGTQGAGKVLISDASGNASWSTVANVMQVFNTSASQTNINATTYIDVAGLSQTITTTGTCYFIINTTGSLESQGPSGWGNTVSACMVKLSYNGNTLTEQGVDIPNNNNWANVVSKWAINYTLTLPAGTYTFKISARSYLGITNAVNGVWPFYAGGATTTALPNDGTMTIQVIQQ